MKKFTVMMIAVTWMLLLQSIPVKAQSWDDFWGSVTSAFEDATKAAKEALKPAIDVGGRTIDLGADAIGAATQQALNAQTAVYGAAKSINSKAFVYFRSAVPLPELWDIAGKVSDNTFENAERLEQSRQAAMTYGGAVAKRMANAALTGDWKSIWDFANGMTGYLTIEPSASCPRPLMAAIFIYNPATNKFKAISINPNLTRGNLSYVYAAPRVELNYDRGTNPDEVSPVDLFIGAVAQLDPKTNSVKWEYSGPCSVLQKSKWKVDFVDGEFIQKLVADDGNIDSKPEKSGGLLPKPDVPSSVNADMGNKEVPYCRNLDGDYSIPVSKGQIIRFGDIITLESVQYNFLLDADDDMCRPLGLNDGIDKQWQVIDPISPISIVTRTPVRCNQKIALKSVKYGTNLTAEGDYVTAGRSVSFGSSDAWWFVSPDKLADDTIRSGHVLGLISKLNGKLLDADDSRCTPNGNNVNGRDKQWRVQLHPEYPEIILPEFTDLIGEYRIRVKADNRYLHADGLGSKLIDATSDVNDDYTRFIFEKQPDNCYRIRVKADGRYLHSNGLGDNLISTRTQESDDFTHFALVKQPDGSHKIYVKADARRWHVDGLGDRLVSTRNQKVDDDYIRFYMVKQ